MIRYPDADIEVEYRKEKAKRKKKPFNCDEPVKVTLKEPKLTGAVPAVHPNSLIDPDAWNNSLSVTAPIEFKEL